MKIIYTRTMRVKDVAIEGTIEDEIRPIFSE